MRQMKILRRLLRRDIHAKLTLVMNETNPLIARLVYIAAYLNRSVTVPILVLGTLGNLFNLIILTRKSLRVSSCLFYFFSSSIANLVCLWCGLLTRLLSGYNLDPTATSTVLFTVVLATLFYGQVFYCYIASPDAFPVFCHGRNRVCQMYNDLLFLLLYAVLPPVLMLGFGWLTVSNVRRIHKKVSPTANPLTAATILLKRRDRQMVTMLLIQVGLFFFTVLPSGLSKAYSTVTFNQQKDTLQLTKENFSFQVNCPSSTLLFTRSGVCLGDSLDVVRQLLVCLLHLHADGNDVSSGDPTSTGESSSSRQRTTLTSIVCVEND